MKRIFIIILIVSLQACAPGYISPFHQPQNNQPHAVLQSTLHKSNLLALAVANPKIAAINGQLISPREEETWKLTPYSKFNIFPGDTFVEVRHDSNGDFGYIQFIAKPNQTYTISYHDNPDKKTFSLVVNDSQGNLLAQHTFRKKRWGRYIRSEKEDAMFDAIAMNDADTVQRLLKEGADPNWIDTNTSLDALYITAKENNIAILDLLIAAGVWVDSYEGAFALSVSSKSGQIEMVKKLLVNGADPNLRYIGENSALMEAAKNGHIQVVRILLKHGAYRKFKNIDGKTAADLAKESGHDEIVSLLSQ